MCIFFIFMNVARVTMVFNFPARHSAKVQAIVRRISNIYVFQDWKKHQWNYSRYGSASSVSLCLIWSALLCDSNRNINQRQQSPPEMNLKRLNWTITSWWKYKNSLAKSKYSWNIHCKPSGKYRTVLLSSVKTWR